MGLDFDAIDYCRSLLRSAKPSPYKCPVDNCNKSYKSIYGLQYHLSNYDHDNPQAPNINFSAKLQRKKGRYRSVKYPQKNSQPIINNSPPKEALTYLEDQKIVQFDIDGKSIKVSVEDEIPIIGTDEFNKMVENGKCAPFTESIAATPYIPLPNASVKLLDNYNICDAPPRPSAYIRFIEKSAEELDGEIEYDVDEEDTTWLSIINEQRTDQGYAPVSIDTLEILMDRLEKESYFQAAANGQNGAIVDDDAVCCICMDGECQNTNVILFCDMCNLAVHQDCYGVPYIPEGQWLCRRCLQSPSRPVDCVLCPNTGGAFKQTDQNQWAHVVCALWIPEVRFANTVFLEPIDSIETIPSARWRLTCYICKQKNIGACIQCQRSNCYAAFHVTCAQQAGLHMRMDTVKDHTNEIHPIIVQKTAYCDAHCPDGISDTFISNAQAEKAREKSRIKMKQARKLLAKKRTSVPLILIPTIPTARLTEIGLKVQIQKKSQFLQRLIAYWTLKRQYRNGVPLLRRLQSQGQTHQQRGIEGSPDLAQLYSELKYWQCLRQDLERSRLLCELVRKREKLKVSLLRITEQCLMARMDPIEASMKKLLNILKSKDTGDIFLEPVDIIEVPDYMDVVKNPMDLGTMTLKLQSGLYKSLDMLELDFDLMIKNCLAYNNKDTIFYRAGIRMRDHGIQLFKQLRKDLESKGLMESQPTDECLAQEIDDQFRELLKMEQNDKLIDKLQILSDKALRLKQGVSRTKRTKQIRIEIGKIKKNLKKSGVKNFIVTDNSSQSEGENKNDVIPSTSSVRHQTPPCSPLKSANSSASPTGVNRRTAVLFTRKAQAALTKKPDSTLIKEESSCDNSMQDAILLSNNKNTKTVKKTVRTKRNSQRKSVESGGCGNVGLNHNSTAVGGTTSSTIDNSMDKLKNPISPHKLGGGTLPLTSIKEITATPLLTPVTTGGSKPTFELIPDSFRVYRGQENRDLSDTEESHITFTDSSCSSCSDFSDSGTGSDFGSGFEDDDRDAIGHDNNNNDDEVEDDNDDGGESDGEGESDNVDDDDDDDDDDDEDDGGDDDDGDEEEEGEDGDDNDNVNADNEHVNAEKSSESKNLKIETDENQQQIEKPLEPLQLVWAKCRGYPWYPALIIDPKIPNGFIYNGVPLPAPPLDVLALRQHKTEPVFLVLFFDVKRTWQWLPANKLELLGLNKEFDQNKLVESRKPSERKAVKNAYEDALHYQSQVSDLDAQGPGAIM